MISQEEIEELKRLEAEAQLPRPECKGTSCSCDEVAARKHRYAEASQEAVPRLIEKIRMLEDWEDKRLRNDNRQYVARLQSMIVWTTNLLYWYTGDSKWIEVQSRRLK